MSLDFSYVEIITLTRELGQEGEHLYAVLSVQFVVTERNLHPFYLVPYLSGFFPSTISRCSV